MMHGPEPDLGWNQVTQIVIELAEHLKVSKTIGLQAIPWPSPHTRDLLVTPHASDPTMIEPRPGPVDRVDVPGSLTTLIEFATGRAGIPSQGFAVHIPHYLVNTEYPTGAITVLEEISKAGGLVIDQGEPATARDTGAFRNRRLDRQQFRERRGCHRPGAAARRRRCKLAQPVAQWGRVDGPDRRVPRRPRRT